MEGSRESDVKGGCMDVPHSGGNVMEALVPHGAGASYVKLFRRKLKIGNLLD